MKNKEIAKDLYESKGLYRPGTTWQFSQLKLVAIGTGDGAPSGEIQVRNTFHGDAIVESITPGNYESEDALYSFLCTLENYNPESLGDWLNRES